MRRREFCAGVLLGMSGLAIAMPPGQARPLSDDIVIGMTAALSGPSRRLGQSMRLGIEACFAEVNRNGGIHGRHLRLVALDDSYHPPTAAANMRKLVADRRVLAVMGSVGTPTAEVTLPIARAEKILFFAPMTGAALLRDDNRYVINFRASYSEETAAMIELLLARGIRPEQIAFFTQEDAYGDDGYAGAIAALEGKGYDAARQLLHGRYPRSTVDVEEALIKLLDQRHDLKAIIMVGSYVPSAKFIRLARQIFENVLYLNVSFVGAESLRDGIGETGGDVIVMTVTPSPDGDSDAARAYRKALRAYDSASVTDFVSFEGYLAARTLVEGLKTAPRIDREGIIDGLLGLGRFDLGLGEPLYLGPDDRQASHLVWPHVIAADRIRPLEDSFPESAGE